MNTTAQTGMGPGLALVDAALSGDAQQVHTLKTVFGNRTLTMSASHVASRAIGLRQDFDDELVMELSHFHLAAWDAYDEFIVRRRDRWRAGSAAIREARRHALRYLKHLMRATTTDLESE